MGNLSFAGTELQHSSLHSGNLGHTGTHTSKSAMTGKLPPSGSTVYLVWGSASQSSMTPLLPFPDSTLWLLQESLRTDTFISGNDGLCSDTLMDLEFGVDRSQEGPGLRRGTRRITRRKMSLKPRQSQASRRGLERRCGRAQRKACTFHFPWSMRICQECCMCLTATQTSSCFEYNYTVSLVFSLMTCSWWVIKWVSQPIVVNQFPRTVDKHILSQSVRTVLTQHWRPVISLKTSEAVRLMPELHKLKFHFIKGQNGARSL